MENIHKFKQWALGVSVAAMLGLGWACTDDDAPDNLAPGFSNYSVIEKKRSSAKLSATLTGPVDLVKEYGFQYSTSSEFPSDKTKTVKAGDGSPVGTFFVDFTGLERNEVYYYRVYASTGGTTVYSEYDVFTTPDSSAPAMSDTRVVSIGENNAIVSFKLDDIGDEYLIECGVGYAKGTSTKAFTPVIATFQDSVYIADITDLEANTTYSFRPYAKNGPKEDGTEGVREGYGDIVYEKTDELMAPEVVTEYESSVGISSMTVSGMVESAVGSDGLLFDCGFVWSSESQKPRLELNDEYVSLKAPEELGEHFVADITGLMANTTYYVCAYARNQVNGELKVGYGEVITLTTKTLMKPNLNIDSYETTASSIMMQATITNYDKGALKEKGFIYDRSSEISLEEAEKNGTVIKTLTGANVYTDTIPGLSMNTSYFVRAYAIFEAEGVEPVIGYSGSYNITTNDYQAPNIGIEANNITRNSVDLTGKMYGLGNGTITERGFLLITTDVTYEPTLKHKGVIKVKSDDSFVSTVTNLKKETSYAFRSYVISSLEAKVDTVYSGGWNSFQTLGINAPAFNNVQVENATYNSFDVTCGITDIGDGKLLEKGFIFKKNSTDYSEDADSVIVVSDNIDEFTTKITRNFEYDNWYYVSCYTKKDIDGVEVISYSSSTSVWLPSPSSTSFDEVKLDSVTYKSLKASAKITSVGDGTLLEKGFFWKKNATDFENGVDSLVVESGTPEEFSASVIGLEYNNWYYGGAYTKMELNGKIVIYRSGWREIWIPEPSGVSFNGINLEGINYKSFKASCGINTLGDGEFVEKGFYYKKGNDNFKVGGDSIVIQNDSLNSYSAIINNIEYDNEYYVCAYVKKILDGKVVISTTGTTSIWISAPAKTSFYNVNLEGINYKSFTASCGVNSLGDGELVEKGFYYKKGNDNFEVGADSIIIKSDSLETYSTIISNIEYDNEYYVCSYVKMKLDDNVVITKSGTSSIWISAPGTTSFYNVNLEGIDYKSFKASCGIRSLGDGELLETGFYYKKNSDNLSANVDSIIVKTDSLETYSAIIDKLEYDNEYYVCSYVKMNLDNNVVIRKSGISSIWISGPSNTSFYDVKLEDATFKSFKATSGVRSLGDGKLLEKGFYYLKSGKEFDTEKDSVIVESDSYNEYSVVIDKNIDYDSYYYVYAYTKLERDSAIVISTSNASSVWIPSPGSVAFADVKLDSTNYHSFIASSGITDLGDGQLLEKGFFWKMNSTDFGSGVDSLVVETDTHEEFSAKIEGLQSNESYYVGAYAKMDINGKNVIYRSGWSYAWTNSPNMPSFDNFDLKSNVYRTLDASVKVSSNGDGEIIEKGFCWRIVGNNDWDYPTIEKNDGSLIFEEESDSIYITLSDLEIGKEYYVRAYAKVKLGNGEQICYSSTHGHTVSSANSPSLDYWLEIPNDKVTRNSFHVKATINSKGNGTITNRGFVMSEYDKNSEPSLASYDKKWDDIDESFEKTITELKHNTTYAIRAFVVAKWEEEMDTIYNGGISTVSTRSVALPSLRRLSISDKSLTSFTVSSEITDQGEGKLKEKGFCWSSATSDFDLNTENIRSKALKDSLKMTLDNLESNTTYYVRAYAKVDIDGIEYVSYSNMDNATTSSYSNPSLNTPKSDSDKLTRNSAHLTGVVSSAGNGQITEKGFVLSKTSVTYEPTLENCIFKVVANADFAADVTGLEWNTSYAARSYAITEWKDTGKKEVIYSGYRTFTTKNITEPKLNSVSRDSITYSSVVVSSSISSLGDGTLVEKGFLWKHNSDNWNEPTLEECTGSQKVDEGTNDSYSLKISSLLPGTNYYVRSYVKYKVDDKEAVSYSSSYSFSTSSLSAGVSITPSITTCEVTVNFTKEAENVKNVIVYLTPAEVNEQDMSKRTKYTLTKDETTYVFTSTLDELNQNTTYYIDIYYEYAGNLIRYSNYEFSTKRVPQSGDNVSPGKKEDE